MFVNGSQNTVRLLSCLLPASDKTEEKLCLTVQHRLVQAVTWGVGGLVAGKHGGRGLWCYRSLHCGVIEACISTGACILSCSHSRKPDLPATHSSLFTK